MAASQEMIERVKSIPSPSEIQSVHPDRTTQTAAVTPEDTGEAPNGQPERKQPVEAMKPARTNPLEVEPDFRLVIEHNIERSVLVYKLINRATGEVMSEISRDDVVKLITDPSYRAGSVIDTRA